MTQKAEVSIFVIWKFDSSFHEARVINFYVVGGVLSETGEVEREGTETGVLK